MSTVKKLFVATVLCLGAFGLTACATQTPSSGSGYSKSTKGSDDYVGRGGKFSK